MVSAVLNALGKRYVVETYQDENCYYVRYSDGWIEQGGREAFIAQNPQIIQLPVEMRDTNYPISLTVNFNPGNLWDWAPYGIPASTNQIKVFNDQGAHSDIFFVWRVEGYAA